MYIVHCMAELLVAICYVCITYCVAICSPSKFLLCLPGCCVWGHGIFIYIYIIIMLKLACCNFKDL